MRYGWKDLWNVKGLSRAKVRKGQESRRRQACMWPRACVYNCTPSSINTARCCHAFTRGCVSNKNLLSSYPVSISTQKRRIKGKRFSKWYWKIFWMSLHRNHCFNARITLMLCVSERPNCIEKPYNLVPI